MDPADAATVPAVATVEAALRSQATQLIQQEEQIRAIGLAVQEVNARHEGLQTAIVNQVSVLTDQVQQLLTRFHPPDAVASTESPAVSQPADSPPVAPASSQLPGSTTSSPPVTASSSVALPLSRPECFSGDKNNCRAFLVQCQLHFELQPAAFPSERSKVAYIISHLTGRAEAWATAEWARNSPVCLSADRFTTTLSKVFDHSTPGADAARALMDLRQGRRSVLDYAIEFRTLATDCGWNVSSLLDAFHHGLAETIKDQLVSLERPADLDSFIALAIKIGNRLRERERARRSFPSSSCRGPPSSSPPPLRLSPQPTRHSAAVEKPMQLGRTSLSPEERQRRLQEGRCIYCGQHGHFLISCPLKGRARQ